MVKLVGVPHLEIGDLNGKQIKGVNQDGLLMVQADWCGHCTHAKPDFQKLYKQMHGKYFIGTVSDEDADVVKMLGIQGFPSFFTVKGGKIMGETNLKARDLAGMKAAL